ncbi:MAG: 16S rRNA (guanine(527)-N(7))-methyltransferase RsmG [Saprospiraceae bacterium]|nr:16S rRNA (guanine(527)-N(7))-methyltransferase RsmG [Saprospiraceae bacterium]
MELIKKYFPELTPQQKSLFEELMPLYVEWNEKINVISRKDIENLYLHHVLHSLAIVRFMPFKPGSSVVDLGTGGGFPGIPLAIFFPDVKFTLIDGTQKKITVVKAVVEALELKNVTVHAIRAEDLKEKFDFVVTRAVAKIDKLLPWTRKLLHQKHSNIYPNGLIALKGDLKEELKLIPKFEYKETTKISNFFPEPYFEEKYILYVQG